MPAQLKNSNLTITALLHFGKFPRQGYETLEMRLTRYREKYPVSGAVVTAYRREFGSQFYDRFA